jgi:dipeptidyl aminopeptidase/acylaminoacyl peptidase
LLIHGEGDTAIPPHQSQGFADALEVAGIRAELLLIPGVEHMQLIMDRTATDAVYGFVAEFSSSQE